LREKKSGDIQVFGGGIIPQEDIPWLRERGILAVFTPGASTEDIAAWVKANINPKR
jgi:methylmalonyl-CoA mutase C-terminal domain/subunit